VNRSEVLTKAEQLINGKCAHKETKPKLVVWAARDRYGNIQGFSTKICCVACGKVIDNSLGNEPPVRQTTGLGSDLPHS